MDLRIEAPTCQPDDISAFDSSGSPAIKDNLKNSNLGVSGRLSYGRVHVGNATIMKTPKHILHSMPSELKEEFIKFRKGATGMLQEQK